MAQPPQADPGVESLIGEELDARRLPGPHMSVVFEEIIELSTGQITGHEVLTRVGLPTGEPVRPEQWFSSARRLGAAACVEARAAELAMGGLPAGDGMVCVNFSPDCLNSSEVRDVLARLGALDRTVVIELAEHHHTAGTRLDDSLELIRDLGLLVAVDDAGTGESGPDFVRTVKPDLIKIDHKHVDALDRDPNQRMSLMSYAHLAIEGGAAMVAEGVSSSRILEALAELGAKCGIGFLGQGHWLTSARPHAWPATV